mmetsp:Transcript_20147/g.26149  ORF Transcript_20147/g.26149 Transcript_20147/m.26149 type:complete len:150 (+) Transcript_20147:270-719(+)
MNKSCTFCRVVSGRSPRRSLMYQDDQVSAFKAKYPRSTSHVLVATNEHILQTDIFKPRFTLSDFYREKEPVYWFHTFVSPEYQTLLRKMAMIGRRVCPNGELVFHVPPFNSIEHLHLHCITGKYQNVYREIAHTPGYPWCVHIDVLLRG